MIRKEAERGRRPLLLGANRQMLETIRDSLSHVRADNVQEQLRGEPGSTLRTELSHSTPNLVDRSLPGNGNRMTRYGYTQKALAEIRNSLDPYKNNEQEECLDVNRQDLDLSQVSQQTLQDLMALGGYDEELSIRAAKVCGSRGTEADLELIQQILEGDGKNGIHSLYPRTPTSGGIFFSGSGNRVVRKPSFEEKYRQSSPVSDNTSIRSESPVIVPRINGSDPPRMALVEGGHHPSSSAPNGRASTPPPPIPPRTHHHAPPTPPRGQTPPPPPLMHPEARTAYPVNHRHTPPIPKEPMGTIPQQASNGPVTSQRGVSPVPPFRQPVIMQNQQNGGAGTNLKSGRIPVMKYSKPPPPLPPYPQRSSPTVQCSSPVNATQPSRSGQSTPTYDSGYDVQIMRNNSNPVTGHPSQVNQVSINLSPMQAWGAKQQPIVMQSVRSREVQKPVAQTATIPTAPIRSNSTTPVSGVGSQPSTPTSFMTSLHTQIAASTTQAQSTSQASMKNVQIHISHNQSILPTPPTVGQAPGRTIQININKNKNPQNKFNFPNNGQPPDIPQRPHPVPPHSLNLDTCNRTSGSYSPIPRAANQSPLSVTSTTSTPSTNSDIPDKPPPPYPGRKPPAPLPPPDSDTDSELPPPLPSPLERNGPVSDSDTSSIVDEIPSYRPGLRQTICTSPIPQRKPQAKWKDEERREFKVKNYSPQAFKFYMEQHMENVLKSHQQRLNRRIQLENEMAKVGLSEEAQCQMRKMLHQKESNYIRLKRAKMDKCMFESIKTLGVGAFGKVALVRKRDTDHLYAMKTLRKSDVLKRNQVAHVKAERDILAEADNEWVVKLYYSFQDTDNLYFVMDYIPGGDMMSLLIKFGIFQEPLARFYIAELVLAIESVHKMGFIHRDIKPDNILIDRDGHIKLTDFGLCTGFRWTHNSKVYQKDGHARQDSMDPNELWNDGELKPLERRKQQDQQRYLAHSLVGTPNYIAPEVLLRSGYSACCDWWSVGVILYEMLVGQPPFYANSPAETQIKVIRWEQYLHIPSESNLSSSAKDLIIRLCRGPEDRLGSRGSAEVKGHRFFQDEEINFDGLRRQQAPYSPVIKCATDTSNFDPVDLHNSGSEPDDLKGKDLTWKNGKHPEHAFFEFTFRRFFDEGGHPYATKFHDPETDAPVYV